MGGYDPRSTLTQTRGAIRPDAAFRASVARSKAVKRAPLVSDATRRLLGMDGLSEPVMTPGACSVCGVPRIQDCLDCAGRCDDCRP